SEALGRPFPGFVTCLSKGQSKKEGRTRTLDDRTNPTAPIFVSIVESKPISSRGLLGVAALNPATNDFHLFSFDDPDYSRLNTLLQELHATEIIIKNSKKKALNEAVTSACPGALISTVSKQNYEGGLAMYRALCNPNSKVENSAGMDRCLSALAGLVKYAEHSAGAALPPAGCTFRLHENEVVICCPLCEKDVQNPRKVEMRNALEIQDHFFRVHWNLRGYACHHCGQMYSTGEQLQQEHDCQEWRVFKMRMFGEGQTEERLEMECRSILLCCADCGWYRAVNKKERKRDEEEQMRELKAFLSHHNNDGLLALPVHFAYYPVDELHTVRFPANTREGRERPPPCIHCGPRPVQFGDAVEANDHHIKMHRDKAVTCEVCHDYATTEYVLGRHQLSHLNENALFADYLSERARVIPPPSMRCAPRRGWKDRGADADTSKGSTSGVDERLNTTDASRDADGANSSAVTISKRLTKGDEAKKAAEKESREARAIRDELSRKFGGCMRGFDGVWFRDEDAAKFREWIDYWESEEGRKIGPSSLVVDASMCSFVPVSASEEMELEIRKVDELLLAGFLLNDNVFYCKACNSILKGHQAIEHLYQTGKSPNKCARNGNRTIRDPTMNENMHLLYHATSDDESSSTASALSCPYCTRKVCSITGLRV
ncbi:hypothetical protein PMAYCL1PPCAC_15253, partial [Pristionchus mayeri]